MGRAIHTVSSKGCGSGLCACYTLALHSHPVACHSTIQQSSSSLSLLCSHLQNYYTRLTCDALKLAMIKNKHLAQSLFKGDV